MNNKINLDILKTAKSYKVQYFNEKIDAEFVKSLRKKLNMTQVVFATVLGINKKTVEKWEQGKNPIIGTSSRLLFLIDKNQNLIENFYSVKIENEKPSQYQITNIKTKIEIDENLIKSVFKNIFGDYLLKNQFVFLHYNNDKLNENINNDNNHKDVNIPNYMLQA